MLEIVEVEQPGSRKPMAEIAQDGGAFGQHVVAVGEGRDARMRVEGEIFGGLVLALHDRHPLRLEGRAGLLEHDMRGERTGARRVIERQHGKPPALSWRQSRDASSLSPSERDSRRPTASSRAAQTSKPPLRRKGAGFPALSFQPCGTV